MFRELMLRTAVPLVVATMVASGCGGGSASEGPRAGDTLRVALGGDPLTINPFDFKAGVNFYAHRQFYETLLTRDKDGALIPALAESHEVSADGLQYSFKLRSGVKFHDGTDMTAEDVKFSIERFADPEIMPFAFLLKDLKSVETPDDLTVVVTFSKPAPIFLSGGGLAFIVPSEIGGQPYEYLDEQAIGTGPVKLVERNIGQGWTMERFDDYWGEPAGYADYAVKVIPDANARLSALRGDQVDFIAPVPPQAVRQLEGQYTIERALDGGALGVTFDRVTPGEAGVIADARVRRAMDLAIDRGPIVETALMGLGEQYSGVGNQFEGAESVTPTEYDPEEAKRLVEEAGATGATVQLYVPKNGRIVNSEEVGQAVAGYWNEIGLNTDLKLITYEEWIDREKNGPAQTYLSSFPDDFAWNPLLRAQSFYGCEGDNSLQCDKKFDAIVDEAMVAPSPEEFQQGYVEALQYVQDASLGIQLHQAVSAFAMADSVCFVANTGRSIPLLATAQPCA